jgi:serine/threonine protein kinase
MSRKEKQDILDEIKHMKALAHPLIVKIIDDFIDNTG